MHLPPFLGLQKTSLIDYPGKVASVLFFPGCNLRCPYCHNAPLALGSTEGLIARDEVIDFLKHRAPLMGGVVITGGEPLLYSGLGDFIRKIRTETGLSVKLDTNGILDDKLETLLSKEAPDFVAMDIKADSGRAPLLGISEKQYASIKRSASLILSSGVEHQFRSTVHCRFINESAVEGIAEVISGCGDYVLNAFKPGRCLDPEYDNEDETNDETLRSLQKLFIGRGLPCRVPSIQNSSDTF